MRAASFRSLPTERHNPASRDIDTLDTRGILRIIHREDARVPAAVAACSRDIARAVDAAVSCLRSGGRLLFVGAGTSGRLGVLEAAECPPTFGISPGLVRAVMAGGRSAVFRSKEGAEDDAREGGRRLRAAARRGDMVVGVAASGITPFVRGALAQARRLGCRTALVTSNAGVAAHPAQIVISPQVGPEVLSGSTRLKSGTAANTEAKIAAAAVVEMLAGRMPTPQVLSNTCYSLVTPDWGISVTAVHANTAAGITTPQGSGGVSPAGRDDAFRKQEAAYARAWYASITKDTWG